MTTVCYSLAIFDLDGTLADSFPWFAGVLNGVADEFGFRRVANDEVPALRRLPPRELMRRLDVPLWKLPRIARHMRRMKSEAIGGIPLFPGTEAMLRTLSDGGVRLALVTSDHEANARRQLGAETAALFSCFECGASLFGKPSKFRRALKRTGIAAGDAIAIGDEVRDIEAARAAGISCGAVTWGYADPDTLRAMTPDAVFTDMDDIVKCLTGASAKP